MTIFLQIYILISYNKTNGYFILNIIVNFIVLLLIYFYDQFKN